MGSASITTWYSNAYQASLNPFCVAFPVFNCVSCRIAIAIVIPTDTRHYG